MKVKKPSCSSFRRFSNVKLAAGSVVVRQAHTLHDQKYVDACLLNISFQNHGHYYGVGLPFAAITASSGKAFHSMLEQCCGDLLPFSHKYVSEVGH